MQIVGLIRHSGESRGLSPLSTRAPQKNPAFAGMTGFH